MVVRPTRDFPLTEVNKAAQLIPKEKLLGVVLNRCRA